MSAYVVLAVPGLHQGVLIPVWVTVLVIARDLLILTMALVFYLALGVRRFEPTRLSKINTIVQVVTAIALLASAVWTQLSPLLRWLPYVVAVTTVASGASYLKGVTEAERRQPPEVPGSS
jgi:cardiolipin synthase (CMP-forming)